MFLLSFLIFTASCKKDKSTSGTEGYYFKANLTDVPTEFNTLVLATQSKEVTSPYLLFVTGKSLPVYMDGPYFTLILNDDTPLVTKTYVTGADPVEVRYSSQMMIYEAEGGFKITISQLTSKEIRGSFSGKLKTTGGHIIDVSEGVFFAPIY
jgi:hypothetical protein